jgi:hypothetical protein
VSRIVIAKGLMITGLIIKITSRAGQGDAHSRMREHAAAVLSKFIEH